MWEDDESPVDDRTPTSPQRDAVGRPPQQPAKMQPGLPTAMPRNNPGSRDVKKRPDSDVGHHPVPETAHAIAQRHRRHRAEFFKALGHKPSVVARVSVAAKRMKRYRLQAGTAQNRCSRIANLVQSTNRC